MKITHQEIQKDSDFIRQKVIEHNRNSLPEQQHNAYGKTSFMARDEAGDIIGGITGSYSWQMMQIDFLWVDPAQQGSGIAAKLIAKIEQHAHELKCTRVTVDTFSFQAPEFYRKQGFREFGILEDHPSGHSQHYFEKRLIE